MRMLGFAPIREMLDSCVCVSLGTDGAPSNNRMSIVDEMYLASLINKGREAYISGTTNPTALPAETLLKMATINGAKAVLWDNEIGSLEVGKKADLVVVNPFTWSMVPLHDSAGSYVSMFSLWYCREYHFPIVTLKTMDTVNCFISVHASFQLLMIAEKSNEYLGTKHQVYWFAWAVALHKVP
ncbi:unnamed protein product [Miscanthus lutarioriparius]|uniref:Amidohydrolase-related domain-containing protein n=1 Tax=Miscanthus lutarioriparius TaxID=422564 RepID=A0A811RC93_9POAL|nr:unnamed protein product [Miscanthus lutarioriparius]